MMIATSSAMPACCSLRMRALLLLAAIVATAWAGAPTEKWQVFAKYGDSIQSAVVTNPSNTRACTVLQGANDALSVYCIKTADGSKVFSRSFSGYSMSVPMLTVLDDIVIAAASTSVMGLDATNGTTLWSQQLETSVALIPTPNTTVAYVGYGPNTLYGIAANGTVSWTQSGQFGQCTDFPKPIYNGAGVVLVCARTMSGGYPAVFAFSATSGTMMWFDFNGGQNPNVFWTDASRALYLKMNSSQYIWTYMVDVHSGMVLWSWPSDMQHATANVVNESVVVVGTWGMTTALDIATGNAMWAIPDPVSLDTTLSVPIPCGPTGLALFHLQLDENQIQALRRVDLLTGNVLWNSTMTVSGADPWYFSPTSGALATRTVQHVYGFNFTTGAQLWSMDLDESQFVSFAGDDMIITKDLMVLLRYSLS